MPKYDLSCGPIGPFGEVINLEYENLESQSRWWCVWGVWGVGYVGWGRVVVCVFVGCVGSIIVGDVMS